MSIHSLVIGTRKSKLALWQSEYVKSLLTKNFPSLQVTLREVVTTGDTTQEKALPLIGGKGLFTAELEEELRRKTIDCAVHSLKDLPTDMPSEFIIAAIPARAPVGDALISKGSKTFLELPTGAVVGTSSPRRFTQLKKLRPDLTFQDIRGNVDTRIRKVREGQYDATVLAEAGLMRLGLEKEIAYRFSPEEMLSAPGQGALAIQILSSREDLLPTFQALDDIETRITVSAERSFLQALGAGCSTPVGALARYKNGTVTITGRVVSLEVSDSQSLSLESNDAVQIAIELGRRLAKKALLQGAEAFLKNT